jgi:hypothetical protein
MHERGRERLWYRVELQRREGAGLGHFESLAVS